MTTTDSRGTEIVQHWLQHCDAPVRVDAADAARLARRIDTVLAQEQFKIAILEARLDGWEAACTAQIQAIEALLPFARTLGATTVTRQAEAAISSDVGRTLLERLERAEAVVATVRAALQGDASTSAVRVALAQYDRRSTKEER
jgi:hypothetical protein